MIKVVDKNKSQENNILKNFFTLIMDETIKQYYELNYFPNLDELYSILKENEVSVTKKQVKEFLEKQHVEQITKEVKKKKSNVGHIVAFYKNQLWQLDIFILQKYKKNNKGYGYLLCAIDVFTRKVYIDAMKNKDNEDVLISMEKILMDSGESPESIMSDSDSTFTSNNFKALMKKKNINHETVPIGDHAGLGIVDRFARTLKKRLTKVIENTKDWINHYKGIINQYNNRPHKSIGNIKPNEADEPDNVATIVEINNNKSKTKKSKSDFSIGDKVRIDTRKIFSKGTEPIWSDEVFKIEYIRGKRVLLNNDAIKKDSMLLKVNNDTPLGILKKSNIRKATKDHKNDLSYKRDSIEDTNVKKTKRTNTVQVNPLPRKPKKKSGSDLTEEFKGKVFKDDQQYFKIDKVYWSKENKEYIVDIHECNSRGKIKKYATTEQMSLKEIQDLMN